MLVYKIDVDVYCADNSYITVEGCYRLLIAASVVDVVKIELSYYS